MNFSSSSSNGDHSFYGEKRNAETPIILNDERASKPTIPGAYPSDDVSIDDGNAVRGEETGYGALPRRDSAGQSDNPHRSPFR